MSVLALPLPATAQECPIIRRNDEPSSFGREGQLVSKLLEDAQRHWLERAERMLAVESEEATYRHVPFEVVGTIRVRYKPAEDLRPRRFPSADDDK